MALSEHANALEGDRSQHVSEIRKHFFLHIVYMLSYIDNVFF